MPPRLAFAFPGMKPVAFSIVLSYVYGAQHCKGNFMLRRSEASARLEEIIQYIRCQIACVSRGR